MFPRLPTFISGKSSAIFKVEKLRLKCFRVLVMERQLLCNNSRLKTSRTFGSKPRFWWVYLPRLDTGFENLKSDVEIKRGMHRTRLIIKKFTSAWKCTLLCCEKRVIREIFDCIEAIRSVRILAIPLQNLKSLSCKKAFRVRNVYVRWSLLWPKAIWSFDD